MTSRVKVYGPSTSDVFGCDVHQIESPANVVENSGVLQIAVMLQRTYNACTTRRRTLRRKEERQ
jgi:hypothetical protein